jgi:archaellum component FlaC
VKIEAQKWSKLKSGKENKVEELGQTVKDHMTIYEWNTQDIWNIMKRPNLQVMGIEEGQEIKA